MQLQKVLEKEEVVEHEILLQGTIKSIREASLEVSTITSVVHAQGELIDKIQGKITNAENTLRTASKKLTGLVRRSRKRRIASICLLSLATLVVMTLFMRALLRG
ncbi:hypothetical protein NEOKW01_2083 [Nematocida sp. AWRm80]|nr:hypothetical protein NEOKW01_2083 [Nematocida sp. AWRm80]